jgi:hypothetical protein
MAAEQRGERGWLLTISEMDEMNMNEQIRNCTGGSSAAAAKPQSRCPLSGDGLREIFLESRLLIDAMAI